MRLEKGRDIEPRDAGGKVHPVCPSFFLLRLILLLYHPPQQGIDPAAWQANNKDQS